MTKFVAYLIYLWGSTILFTGLILWLATIENLETANGSADETIKVLFRLSLYAILFLLIYRSILGTLKNTVSRLAVWHSKKEKAEDAQFVLVIESLVIIISILTSVLVAVTEEYIQSKIDGRISEAKDVLVSTLAVLLTAITVYSVPVLGELELILKMKSEKLVNNLRKDGRKK